MGWNIDIRSEEEIKREVTEQMGALIASGEAVPLSVIEGVTPAQADALAEHGINDIDALAQTSVDDLVEFLDLSLDEAEVILSAAIAVIAMRERIVQLKRKKPAKMMKQSREDAVSVELKMSNLCRPSRLIQAEPADETTAEGYDEAVESAGLLWASRKSLRVRRSVSLQ